jgi:hypothetical protein
MTCQRDSIFVRPDRQGMVSVASTGLCSRLGQPGFLSRPLSLNMCFVVSCGLVMKEVREKFIGYIDNPVRNGIYFSERLTLQSHGIGHDALYRPQYEYQSCKRTGPHVNHGSLSVTSQYGGRLLRFRLIRIVVPRKQLTQPISRAASEQSSSHPHP